LLISNRKSFRVLFDKIVYVHFIWKMYLYFSIGQLYQQLLFPIVVVVVSAVWRAVWNSVLRVFGWVLQSRSSAAQGRKWLRHVHVAGEFHIVCHMHSVDAALSHVIMWNSLPDNATSASLLPVFKNRLKTYLFRCCYETVWLWITFLFLVIISPPEQWSLQ